MKEKLYAIVHNGIVVNGWFAETIEEAQKDNPGATIIEATVETGPFTMGEKVNING